MHELRLTAKNGSECLARVVYHGERYGADRRLTSSEYRTIVEFVVPRGVSEQFLGAYVVDEMPPLEEGFCPVGVAALALTGREADRLGRWLADPSSVEDTVVLLVGLDDELRKAGVALRDLRLDPREEPDGRSAIERARRFPPLLVVVGEEVRSVTQLDVVRGLRRAPETRDVPIAVLGGDAEAATAAGAALHVAKPLDYHALVDGAAVLLEFV